MTLTNAKHKSNQSNPRQGDWQKVNDNRSNQGNRDSDAYWQSRNLPIPAKKK